jgi:hypothetical protein
VNLPHRDLGGLFRRWLDHLLQCLLRLCAFTLYAGHLILGIPPGQIHDANVDVLVGGLRKRARHICRMAV